MSEQMQEEFEKWFNEIGKLAVLADTLKDGAGNYYFAETRLLWECWKSSRQALVVELPRVTGDAVYDAQEVLDALDRAGVSYR